MNDLEVRWRGFRGMASAQDFTFPRLTILIGRNNVGKTSAYAPLLLLRQTLDARDPDTALLTRGSLIDVGNFKDLIYNHDKKRELQLSLNIPVGSRYLPASAASAQEIDVSFAYDEGRQRIWLKRSALLSGQGEVLIERSRASVDESFSVKSSFLPRNVTVGRPLREVSALKENLSGERPEGYLFTGLDGLRLPAEWREDEERWSKVRPWFNAASKLYEIQLDAKYRIVELLQGIAYLGPLRSLPQRTYRLAAERPGDVGREGQFAPEILFRGHDEGLRDNVNSWLDRLGYGRVNFEKAGDEYFQVFLESGNRQRVNIADCGVGISQLLPILVQGYTAPRSATFVSQQPEIHLNPAQQSVIADFLIEATREGSRRVIVETHSEHVLLRVRRRIAEGVVDARDVAVYYFESQGGRTSVRKVTLGEGGEIDEWPEGFFEEQLNDAFALSRAQVMRGSVG